MIGITAAQRMEADDLIVKFDLTANQTMGP